MNAADLRHSSSAPGAPSAPALPPHAAVGRRFRVDAVRPQAHAAQDAWQQLGRQFDLAIAAGGLLVLAAGLWSLQAALERPADAVSATPQALWQAGWPLLLVLAGVTCAALAWARLCMRRLGFELDQAVAHARSLREGHLVTRAEASSPGLAPLAQSMNLLVERLRAVFDAQAEQLAVLHDQAHADPLTGLANRRHFMARLEQVLSRDDGAGEASLLLLRVRDLHGMNRRIGHAATDHVLQALAQTLQSYPRRVEGCFAGRLNGADFALLLPVGGIGDDTAQSVLQALRQPLSQVDAGAGVAAGVVELRRPALLREAMALADEALARAEASGSFGVDCVQQTVESAPRGESSWQRRIVRALDEGRVSLAGFAVNTPDGRLLHLDCPLRVQIDAGSPPQPASRWLSLATRGRLCVAIDERALELALAEIERDGTARCINFSPQSLASAEFVAMVARRLEAAPEAACRLWIDLPESLALERPALVREASRRWRPLGVMLCLEHAGDGLGRIQRLIELGLDCVRIDGRYVNGLAGDDAADARRYLQGLVRLVQSVGLSVTAEGVRSAADLELLWSMGFDAATGPALSRSQTVEA